MRTHQNGATMLRRRILGILMSLALLLGVPATTLLVTAGPASASTAEAVVDMPFSGQWAYNATVYPNSAGKYVDSCPDGTTTCAGYSSHPSVHAKYYGDWATDLYAAAGTAVKLHVTSPDGTVTFSYNRSNDTCSSAGTGVAGHGIVLNVLVNNVVVGSIDYEHLDSISSGPYTNGMTIGKITSEPLANAPTYCYTVRHVHVELKNNTAGTYSCWVDHGSPGVSVTESDHLGVLGSPNIAERQKCASVPSATNKAPTATINDATGVDGDTVILDGTKSSDPDGSIASWKWDLGDGTTFSGSKVSHKYQATGWYQITLTVTDNKGALNATSVGFQASTLHQFLADVNGDGKADAVVYFPDGSWYVALANTTGTGFIRDPNTWKWADTFGVGSTRQLLADVNGDGRADAVTYFSDGSWYVALANTTGTGFIRDPNTWKWADTFGLGS